MSAQMTATELNKMRIDTVPDERTPAERKKARRKLAKAKRKKKAKAEVVTSAAIARDRKLAVITVVVVGLVLLGIIFVSAYCATIKYDINKTNKEAIALQEEIDYLKVEIENGTNIGTIEEKALKELGMIYPTADQFEYLEAKTTNKEDMAQVIKDSAYEYW